MCDLLEGTKLWKKERKKERREGGEKEQGRVRRQRESEEREGGKESERDLLGTFLQPAVTNSVWLLTD